MNLFEAKTGCQCIIKQINIEDEKIKVRLMELGLLQGVKIYVKHKSILKKTLLIVFNSACFTLKDNLAKNVQVEYA